MFTYRRFERVSTDDLMSLASEQGSTPLQVGAVLMLDGSEKLEPGLVLDALADRVCAVPRLRQRLVEVPWGCGRPVWVDDRDFAVSSHFSVIGCPAPGGVGAVLGVAADMLLTRLPRDRALWAAKLVTDTGGGGAALIVVFHRVLADGIGGLAVLAGLVDGAANARNHVHDALAFGLFGEGALNRFDLTANATDAGRKLLLVSNRMRHEAALYRIPPYPIWANLSTEMKKIVAVAKG